MVATRAFGTGLVTALGLGIIVGACSDDAFNGPSDAGADAPFIDAGGNHDDSDDPDANGPEVDEPTPDASPSDTAPPDRVTDLAGSAVSHVSVKLTWTAPADDTGMVAGYELRYATTPITTLAAFMEATNASAPAPLAPGSGQTATVTDLAPETEYHFAIRARDAAGNFGELSSAAATTKARATFLISEIAPLNTANEGGDFVELVATKAGAAEGIEIRHSSTGVSAPLHKLGALEVAAGDRIVVHVVGLPGPTGFAQEDVTNDKASSTGASASPEAYDVYSSVSGLLGTNSLISVMDGSAYQDAVPYSSRAADASAAAMTAFANAHAAGAWTFSTAPVDGTNDCPTLLEVVNASGNSSPSGCGGFPGYLVAGSSLQRNGVVDTNSRADFFVAAQTRGAENAPFCAPEGATLAITEVNPRPGLVELTATQGGSLRGFTVRRDPREGNHGTLLATLTPICAATGDKIVLHLGAVAGTPSETSAKDEHPVAMNAGFYDEAWDVASTSGSSALPLATSLVIAVRDPVGAYVEAAAFSNMTTTPSEGSAYHQSLTLIQSFGLWLPADCGGVMPCSNTTTPTARQIAASWNGVGALATDNSCSRASATSATEAASWSVGAQSFGQ